MSVHVIAVVDVTDADTFGKYGERANEAVMAPGGKVVSISGPNKPALEDTGAASTARFVLIEFPSAEDAQGWMSDPEFQSVHEVRRGGATTTIRLMTPR